METMIKEFSLIQKETDRLVIRPCRIEDYHIRKLNLKNQLEQASKYDEDEIDLYEHFTEELCLKFAENGEINAKNDKQYLFSVFNKENGDYIGAVIIKTIKRQDFQWGEVGYWLLNQHWKNGYGTEMVKGAIQIAFNDLGFHRIEAHVNLDNIPSQRTATSAGMKFECTREKFIFEDEQWTDNMVFVVNKN